MTARSLAALLFVASTAISTIAAADPFSVSLPAGLTTADETPWVAFTIESNADGKHTTRFELQSLEEFAVFCTDDVSECRNNTGNSGETILHVDGTPDDPNAMTKINAMLTKRKYQPLPYTDLKPDGSVHEIGDVKVGITKANDGSDKYAISINGKQVRTVTLTRIDTGTHSELLGVAVSHTKGKPAGWLMLKCTLTNGKNQTTTWRSTDFPMP